MSLFKMWNINNLIRPYSLQWQTHSNLPRIIWQTLNYVNRCMGFGHCSAQAQRIKSMTNRSIIKDRNQKLNRKNVDNTPNERLNNYDLPVIRFLLFSSPFPTHSTQPSNHEKLCTKLPNDNFCHLFKYKQQVCTISTLRRFSITNEFFSFLLKTFAI